MTTIALPTTVRASAVGASFHLETNDAELTNTAGASQITTYPDRRWAARLQFAPKSGTDLLAWQLALAQLAVKSNVFAMGPPNYTGPSTGYAGAAPLVAGAAQTGMTLDVDGMTPSAAILLVGDFVSFESVGASGVTNRQLVQVTSNVTANISGEATLALALPIRTSPADNATVEIFSPTTFFAMTGNRGGVDNFDASGFGTFIIEVKERVWP